MTIMMLMQSILNRVRVWYLINMNTTEIKKRIEEIEALMLAPDFWEDAAKAQTIMKELQDLKQELIQNDFSNQYFLLDAR